MRDQEHGGRLLLVVLFPAPLPPRIHRRVKEVCGVAVVWRVVVYGGGKGVPHASQVGSSAYRRVAHRRTDVDVP